MTLFSYKMTNDSGFAPNPFFGIMTLATCKPGIRKGKDENDWIAGFTSRELCGDAVGQERLVFLMEITEEKLDQSKYYNAKMFKIKIPKLRRKDNVYHEGDNIYRPKKKNPKHLHDFEQKKNPNHWDDKSDSESIKHKKRDLSGENVLVSKHFYYFGRSAIQIPRKIRPSVPTGVSPYGTPTEDTERAKRFIDFIERENNCRKGVLCAPHKWPENDMSWKY